MKKVLLHQQLKSMCLQDKDSIVQLKKLHQLMNMIQQDLLKKHFDKCEFLNKKNQFIHLKQVELDVAPPNGE